jgi:predicted nucleic acid-binding protein
MLFAYWVQDNPAYAPRVEAIISRLAERQDTLCTSVFTVGEVLAGAYRDKDLERVRRIKQLLAPPVVDILPFNAETTDYYGRIRALTRVKPADAIHLATAAQHGVVLFLTHDKELRRLVIPGIGFIAGLDVNLF